MHKNKISEHQYLLKLFHSFCYTLLNTMFMDNNFPVGGFWIKTSHSCSHTYIKDILEKKVAVFVDIEKRSLPYNVR